MSPKNNKNADSLCMKLSLNPNKSVQRHLSPLFKHSFFSLSSSLSKISEPPSQNQQNDKHSVDYHPCSSRLASRIHPFNIYVNYLALSLHNVCWIYSAYAIIFEKSFYSCPLSLLKILVQVLIITFQAEKNYIFHQAAFFSKSVFPNKRKWWGKLWSALSKFIQKIWISLGTLGYSYFVWFSIFSNVMALQLCR